MLRAFAIDELSVRCICENRDPIIPKIAVKKPRESEMSRGSRTGVFLYHGVVDEQLLKREFDVIPCDGQIRRRAGAVMDGRGSAI